MDKLSVLTKRIEIDFLKTVAEALKKGTITLPISKQAGKEFLRFYLFTSDDDMHEKIKKYIDKFPQLEKIYPMLLTYIDEEKTDEILDKLRLYIHNNE